MVVLVVVIVVGRGCGSCCVSSMLAASPSVSAVSCTLYCADSHVVVLYVFVIVHIVLYTGSRMIVRHHARLCITSCVSIFAACLVCV